MRTFAEEHSLETLSVEKQFERFAAYCSLVLHYVGRVNFENVVTDDQEAGIDAVAYVIDEELVTTPDDAQHLFSVSRRNREVELIFVQATTTPKFERQKIVTFGDAVVDFLRTDPELPQGEVLINAREIFEVILQHVQKIKGGKPTCSLSIANAGVWADERELIGSLNSVKRNVQETGFFTAVEFIPLDRDLLIHRWTKSREAIEARLEVRGYLPFPEIEGVTEAYIAIIPAKEFVDKLIHDSENNIRTTVFQENVRSFLGEDNEVNRRILETLQADQGRDRFCILNNGITVISPDIRVQADTISLNDFQVVNGCQTSHILARNYDLLDDSVMVTVKVIEAADEAVIAEVVEATNSQTEVKGEQFLSLRPAVRRIEQYFDSYDPLQEPERKLYFERREKQFSGQGIPDIRIFDIRTLARAYTSIFLERPHLAGRYPASIFAELAPDLFQDDHQEISYYTAALAYYRLQVFLFGGRIPATMMKYKWQLLMAFKYLSTSARTPQPNAHKMARYCELLQNILINPGQALQVFQECVTVLNAFGEISRDRLKTAQFTSELRNSLNIKLPRA